MLCDLPGVYCIMADNKYDDYDDSNAFVRGAVKDILELGM